MLPISEFWKPEQKRFNACVIGRLLIITPCSTTALGDVDGVPAESDYSQFHNLNKVAEQIC
ncbi:MAG: hypothetical protein KBT06_04110 [Prevotellaceae bacterium]|nr:hypothetical protein [Candidatus Colivivens equi]